MSVEQTDPLMMTSNRPYLIRALYDWILDNQMTPHLLVDAERPSTVVPQRFVQEGRIVLNISPSAVKGLVLGNEYIGFDARFDGASLQVSVPMDGVLGIYARENGRGMLFPQEETEPEGAESGGGGDEPNPPSPPRERPSLKIVK